MSQQQYRRAFELQSSGRRYPATNLVRENPKAAAVISKLVADPRNKNFKPDGDRNIAPPNVAQFRQTAMQTAQNISDAETVNQVLPDTDLAAQILVSSILSPKDMMAVSLNYASADGKWKLPHELSTALIDVVRTHFEQDYKIKPLLPKMLRDILFRTGSYALAVIPENAVDEIINSTGSVKMESFSDLLRSDGNLHSMGLLGPRDEEKANSAAVHRNTPGLVLESLIKYEIPKETSGKVKMAYEAENSQKVVLDPYINVTDNFNLLKIPDLSQRMREERTRQILSGDNAFSLESLIERYDTQPGTIINNRPNDPTKMGDRQLVSRVYKAPRNRHQTVVTIKTQDKLARRSVGSPLVMHLPSEAVIPVHVPNRPDHQIGYFILIDQEGNPISKNDSADYYKELNQRMQAGDSFASSMLERSKQLLSDSFNVNSRTTMDYSAMIYGQMLEDDLNQRLRNGLVGGNAVIAKNQEVYRLMMARSLSQQHTQLLYIPAEFMTYIAFRYHSNGIGKSLLEDGRILNSMRTMLLVANVMTSLRNSIGRTHVNLKLDPDSPDPMKNIEQMIGEIMRVNSNSFPLGSNNPTDIVESMQRAAFEFSFSGHPGIPDMEVEFSEKNSNYAQPDTALEELLRKRAIMMYGLTPEMVDAAAGSDFATSVNANTILLSKRVLTYQQDFVPQLSDHMRKYMIASADIMEELVKLIEGSYVEILKGITEKEKIKLDSGQAITKDQLQENKLYKAVIIKEVLEEFISNFNVSLPEPDVTKIDNENESYEKYEKLLDSALNAWISEDMFTSGELGAATEHIRAVRSQMKAYFLREWQIRNGVIPELAKITSKGPDGNAEINFQKAQVDHVESLLEAIQGLFKGIKSTKEKTDKILEDAGLSANGGGGFGGTGDFGHDTGGDGAGGFGDTGGFGGGDDFGGSGDVGSASGDDDLGFGQTDSNADAGGFGSEQDAGDVAEPSSDAAQTKSASEPEVTPEHDQVPEGLDVAKEDSPEVSNEFDGSPETEHQGEPADEIDAALHDAHQNEPQMEEPNEPTKSEPSVETKEEVKEPKQEDQQEPENEQEKKDEDKESKDDKE